MRNRFFLILCIYFFLPFHSVQAQNKGPKKYGKFLKVEITDPMQLFAGYLFSEKEEELVRNAVGAAKFDSVIANYQEINWPPRMVNLDERFQNLDKTKMYRVYLVTEFPNDKVLLVAPKKRNKHMPEGYRPEKDFFMVLFKNGIIQF